MNSIVLLGEVATRPELRETQDGLARASFILRFGAQRPEEPDYQVQVVAFGNTAGEVNDQYVQGDQVVVEGRLQMNSITKQDGTREKRAEVIVRRLHPIGKGQEASAPLPPPPTNPPISRPPAYKAPSVRPIADQPAFNDEIPF
ncbi:single-stranded DNA-binding protein [Anthocerotibacter panamensis]|uniref:single-stranded DNA-binding protein n=1 Tax=Anthocerotibacter panamensis TaxID=2857077 RepID=UPI001C40499F|nr:single-stranded DNA-binding protein [Anthocerotibacter panamensis]